MGSIKDIRDNIGRVLVGKDETVLLTVVAMVAGGHVLFPEPARQCLLRHWPDQ